MMRLSTRLLVAVLVAAAVAVACKRRSSAEKTLMRRIAGTWVWREPNSSQPTVVVLELTAKGKYKRATFKEVAGKRKLFYVNHFTKDLVVEPDSPEEIKRLKKKGYDPAVDTGRYMVSVEENIQRIAFESDSLTRAEVEEGSGVREQLMVLRSDNQLTIGGRTYRREAGQAGR